MWMRWLGESYAHAQCCEGHLLSGCGIVKESLLYSQSADQIFSSQSPHMPTLGARPLFHFSGPHFSPDLAAADSDASHVGALSMCNQGVHASFQHLKSFFLDFYRGEEAPPGSGPGAVPGASGNQVALRDGLQHVVCITEAPEADDEADAAAGEGTSKDLADLYAAGAAKTREGPANLDPTASGRKVYMRVYAVLQTGKAAGGGAKVELKEVGPSLDLVLRRRQPADAQRLAAALKRPKTAAEKNTQGKSKRKNVETDDMGDMVGRVHMQKQDLTKLQTRKMKGLKVGRGEGDEEDDEDEEGDFDEEDGSEVDMESGDDGQEDDDMADLMGSDAEMDDDEGEDEDDEEEDVEEPAPAPVKKQRKG